ncbi:MAG: alpha/beta hydrolase [Pseudomonadota bacterium]
MPSLTAQVLRRALGPTAKGGLSPSNPIEDQRRHMDRTMGMGASILSAGGVSVTQTSIGGVACLVCEPPSASGGTIVHIHGGGFCLGSTKSHRVFATHYAKVTGLRVVLPDYRLAPEHPFPAGLDDCVSVVEACLGEASPGQKVIISGDSAGGALALLSLVRIRDGGGALGDGLVLLSPFVDLTAAGESYETRADRDILVDGPWLKTLRDHYVGGVSPTDPLVSPLFADLSGLPPTALYVTDDEILLSDSLTLRDRMEAAGVPVDFTLEEKLWHIWPVFAPILPEARQSLKEIASWIGGLGRQAQAA